MLLQALMMLRTKSLRDVDDFHVCRMRLGLSAKRDCFKMS